ncbi:MAG: thiosulfate dehydrogenase (quinone) large subunit [Pseudonocardiales bacterium]|nr:thiosulfate dehydrogenase (quinone) large subunit [Pseudonocardiales bacterium]
MDTTARPAEVQLGTATRYQPAGIRLALGWVFLWAFLDEHFGSGHDTAPAKPWLSGGSPTKGFLGSSKAPFADFFHSIAGLRGRGRADAPVATGRSALARSGLPVKGAVYGCDRIVP